MFVNTKLEHKTGHLGACYRLKDRYGFVAIFLVFSLFSWIQQLSASIFIAATVNEQIVTSVDVQARGQLMLAVMAEKPAELTKEFQQDLTQQALKSLVNRHSLVSRPGTDGGLNRQSPRTATTALLWG